MSVLEISISKTFTLWSFNYYFLRFQCHTTEAAKLETEVTKAQDTITAAQQLISQLDGEHTRWNTQVVWYTVRMCLFVYWCESFYTFAKKGAHLPFKSNRRCERDRQGGCILLSWVPSGCFYSSTASVCTLIKILNLFLTHIHTQPHAHCLPQGLHRRPSLLSTHIFSHKHTHTHTLHS